MVYKKGHKGYWKGKRLSKEHRKKLSEANKGKDGYWKGKHFSEKHRREISRANKGHERSVETKQKMSEAKKDMNHPMYDKHLPENTRNKISKTLKELYKKQTHHMHGKQLSEEIRKKISKTCESYWKKHPDVRRKYSETEKGENNPNWHGGLSFEPYGVEFNESLKEQIRERDNHQCQICGISQDECFHQLDIHHVDYDKKNNNPKNLVSLCHSCHMRTNTNRSIWKTFFIKLIQLSDKNLQITFIKDSSSFNDNGVVNLGSSGV